MAIIDKAFNLKQFDRQGVFRFIYRKIILVLQCVVDQHDKALKDKKKFILLKMLRLQ